MNLLKQAKQMLSRYKQWVGHIFITCLHTASAYVKQTSHYLFNMLTRHILALYACDVKHTGRIIFIVCMRFSSPPCAVIRESFIFVCLASHRCSTSPLSTCKFLTEYAASASVQTGLGRGFSVLIGQMKTWIVIW